jgi:LmbE family N-acetylglucosaminyl deacetylase
MLQYFKAKKLRSQLAALPPCPLPQALDLTQAKKVLVFAPHPDDETLGCGGTLAQLAQICPVKVVLVTDGSGAGELPAGTAEIRQEEFKNALKVLGVTDTLLLNQPDGAFQGSPTLSRQVQALLHDYQPTWVFMPSPLDYHRDHLRITAFLEPLCRAVPSVTHLVFYEIWAPVPATHVVDITDQIAIKHDALNKHVTALACGDYLEASDGLNRYRGLYLGKGRFAEAFWVNAVNDPHPFQTLQGFSAQLVTNLAQDGLHSEIQHPNAK